MTSLKHSSSSSSFSFFPNPRMEPTKKKKKSLITILLTKLVPLPSSNYKAFFAPPREVFEPSAIKIQYQSLLLLLLLLEQILVVPNRIAFQNKPPAPAGYLLLRFFVPEFLGPPTKLSKSHSSQKPKFNSWNPKRKKKEEAKKKTTKKFQPYIVKNSSWDCTSSSLLPPSFLPSFPRSLTVS
jgi:hypothetical protein